MAKAEHYLLLDSETTLLGNPYDLAAIVTNKRGEILHQLAVIVADYADQPLFYDIRNPAWSLENAEKKKGNYALMLQNGQRTRASIAAVNKWLMMAISKYPGIYLTAYNLSFDYNVLNKAAIDLMPFTNRFCLWHAACNILAGKKYYNFALAHHYFNDRTKKGNMTIQTNAERMAHYVKGYYQEEQHTALSDVIDFELPILKKIVNSKGWKNKLEKPYNWNDFIVRDKYKA